MSDVFQISQRVNDALGYSAGLPGGTVHAPKGTAWDCQIGSLPFLFAFSDQAPYIRETADFRRQRVDTASSPGEQSLDSGYWVRSQESWHYGAGLRNAEPLELSAEEYRFRYSESGGVDPWTAGQLTLLHSTSQHYAAEGDQLMIGVTVGDYRGVLHVATFTPVPPEGWVGPMVEQSSMAFISADGTATPISWGGSGVITSITTDGENWYAGSDNGIYSGALPAGAGAKIWDTGDTTMVRWVKSRLMATVGSAVYELTGTGPTLPTPLDPGTTRPAGWVWTDIAEGPAAIYLSGYAGDTSAVERITVSTTSSTVTLDVPTVVADMPRSEIVNTLYSYVGSYLLIGTSAGLRVAAISTDGTLVVGPLTLDTAPVDDVVAVSNFAYVTVRANGSAGDRATRAGLYRVNLGQALSANPLQFAHAADLVAPEGATGEARQVTVTNGALYFTVNGYGVVKEDASYVQNGWLESGRIRLGTTEAKTWRDLRLLVARDTQGSVAGYANRDDDSAPPSTWQQAVGADGVRYDRTGKISSNPNEPATALYIAVRLTASADLSGTPVLLSYQLRAIPSPVRTRMIKVPIMLFDRETDKAGNVVGYDGYAFDRLQLLEALEQQYALTPFYDYTTGERVNTYIERVSYSRTAPPRHAQGNNGGICSLLLRVV